MCRKYVLPVLFCYLLFFTQTDPVGGGTKGKRKHKISNQLVEINMSTHRLTFYEAGRVVMRLPISGGGEYWYTWYEKKGKRRIKHRSKAHTPRGNFSVYHKLAGEHESSKGLGEMYYPVYFVGGIAIHGGRVPHRKHVSHGCVRVPMNWARRFSRRVQYGAAVRVY